MWSVLICLRWAWHSDKAIQMKQSDFVKYEISTFTWNDNIRAQQNLMHHESMKCNINAQPSGANEAKQASAKTKRITYLSSHFAVSLAKWKLYKISGGNICNTVAFQPSREDTFAKGLILWFWNSSTAQEVNGYSIKHAFCLCRFHSDTQLHGTIFEDQRHTSNFQSIFLRCRTSNGTLSLRNRYKLNAITP